MRINKYVAQSTGLSRRNADDYIKAGKVTINGQTAALGDEVQPGDTVKLESKVIKLDSETMTIMLNKPVGYVCSREGQGSKTIYDLLPEKYHHLKPAGRLDKDSSGLLLLTNDGELAHQLTHPFFKKVKVYEVELDKPLKPDDKAKIEQGIMLEDGVSRLTIEYIGQDLAVRGQKNHGQTNPYTLIANPYRVAMTEGRNRQIRRTFAELGYKVVILHRNKFGNYTLGGLQPGKFIEDKSR